MVKLVGLVPLLLVGACSMNGQQKSILQRNGTRVPVESADVANAELLPDPDIRSATHLAAARLLQSNGQLGAAIEQYQKAVAANPNNFEAQHKLGLLLGILARHDEAEENLRRATELNPDSAVARNDLGFTYVRRHKWEQAERELRRAITLEPEFPRARVNLALVVAARGEYDEALRLFRDVLPKPDAYYNLGLTYRAHGRFDDAREAFSHVLSLRPDFGAARRQIENLPARRAKPVGRKVPGGIENADESIEAVAAAFAPDDFLVPDAPPGDLWDELKQSLEFERASSEPISVPPVNVASPPSTHEADAGEYVDNERVTPADSIVEPFVASVVEVPESANTSQGEDNDVSVVDPETGPGHVLTDGDDETVAPTRDDVKPANRQLNVAGEMQAVAALRDQTMATPVDPVPLESTVAKAEPPGGEHLSPLSEIAAFADASARAPVSQPGDNAPQDTAGKDTDDPESSVDEPVSPISEGFSSPAATTEPEEFAEQEDITPANPIDIPTGTSKEDEFETANSSPPEHDDAFDSVAASTIAKRPDPEMAHDDAVKDADLETAAPNVDTSAPRTQPHNLVSETQPVATAELDIIQEPNEPKFSEEFVAELESHEEQHGSPPSEIAAWTEAPAGGPISMPGEEFPNDLLEETPDEDASVAESATEDSQPPLPMPGTDDVIAAHGPGDSLRRAPAVTNARDQSPPTGKKPVPEQLRNGIDEDPKPANVCNGDFDLDGDVDLDDFAQFRGCFGGDGKAVEKDCHPGDFDDDGDVDLLDYRAFQVALTSP